MGPAGLGRENRTRIAVREARETSLWAGVSSGRLVGQRADRPLPGGPPVAIRGQPTPAPPPTGVNPQRLQALDGFAVRHSSARSIGSSDSRSQSCSAARRSGMSSWSLTQAGTERRQAPAAGTTFVDDRLSARCLEPGFNRAVRSPSVGWHQARVDDRCLSGGQEQHSVRCRPPEKPDISWPDDRGTPGRFDGRPGAAGPRRSEDPACQTAARTGRRGRVGWH